MLFEREEELQAVEDALASARGGAGRLVVIDGQAGLGKTALIEESVARATGAGMKVAYARCSQFASQVPFGVALQLFEPLVSGANGRVRSQLFRGAARCAAPLFSGGPVPSVDGELPILHGLFRLVSNMTGSSGLVISVDDAQWTDESSLRFLVYLAEGVQELPVAVLLALRHTDPQAPEHMLIRLGAAPAARQLELAPLSRSAADRLTQARLPAASEEFLRACYGATTGNPFLLSELVAAVDPRVAEPLQTAQHLADCTPGSVRRWALVRLSQLPPGSLELARAVAVLGDDARFSTASALAALDPDVAACCADALGATAILDTADELAFVQPLVRSSVYDQIPTSHRARMHRRAARILEREGASPVAVADQLLLASQESDPWTVGVLRQAARDRVAKGAPGSAAGYLARALREPPRSDIRVRVLVELAEAETLAGASGAAARADEALELLEQRREQPDVLLGLGRILHGSGRVPEAASVFERGLANVGEADRQTADDLTAGYLAAALMDPARARAARRHARQLFARSLPGHRLSRGVLAGVMAAWLLDGERFENVLALAERVVPEDPRALLDRGDGTALWQVVTCLGWCDALDRSERICSNALSDAQERNSALTMAEALCGRSWSRHSMGRINEAIADAPPGLDALRRGSGTYVPVAAHALALCHIERDELEQASEAFRLAAKESSSSNALCSFVLAGEGRLAMARGEFAGALEAFLAAGASIEPVTSNPALLAWRSDAALACARLGDRARASRLIADELRLARRFGAPRPIGVALRAAGLIEGGEPGTELLRGAVATLERSQARLELARALVDLGTALRRAGRRTDARKALQRGVELAEGLDARVLARCGREELLAAGARPRRRALRGPGSLTPGERRVAELAARPLTNREIADALFVTRKAVRFHLGNAYKKLEVAGREELAAALKEPG